MNPIPPLNHRIIRVVIRMGGTGGDAARALGCSKGGAKRLARRLGLSFRNARHIATIERAKAILREAGVQ